jgi:hypothetical protein
MLSLVIPTRPLSYRLGLSHDHLCLTRQKAQKEALRENALLHLHCALLLPKLTLVESSASLLFLPKEAKANASYVQNQCHFQN